MSCRCCEGIRTELQKDIQNRRVQTNAKLLHSKSMSMSKSKKEDDHASNRL